MNASPDLIRQLRSSRPTASPALRGHVRELVGRDNDATRTSQAWLRLPARRVALVALPAAAVLAFVSAGAIGLSRSGPTSEAFRADDSAVKTTAELAPGQSLESDVQGSAVAPTPGRAQRVSATLTLEVADAEAVSRAAQDALDLTRALGGYVVSASVATGEEGTAALTVRVPVAKVQEAIVELSALGRITSQQVAIDDLQATLDELERREASLRAQIARITARLASRTLDAETRAVLESRRNALRVELREVRSGITTTNAEARMATIQMTILTPGVQGVVPVPSRFDRTLDEALNVLVWEGVVALALLIVVAPFALAALAYWLGRRLYRRHEDDRLLAAS